MNTINQNILAFSSLRPDNNEDYIQPESMQELLWDDISLLIDSGL